MLQPDDISFLIDIYPEIVTDSTFAVTGPTFVTRTNRIYRASGTCLPNDLAIKCSQDAPLEEEYEGLIRANATLQNSPNCRVPQVHGISANKRSYGLDWIDGKSVQQRLSRPATSVALAMKLAQISGTWIATLHNPNLTNGGAVDTTGLLEDVCSEISRANLTVTGTLASALTMIERRAPQVAAAEVPQTRLHADFKPANILIAENDCGYGLDILHNGTGPIQYDLAQFMNSFSLDLYTLAAPRLLRHSRAMETPFLSAYTDISCPVDNQVLTWLRIQKHLLLALQTINGKKPMPTRKLLLWAIKNEIRKILADT